MSRQTAIANINKLIQQEREAGTTRKKHSSIDTIDALLEEERRREEEQRQRNAASAGEVMDLVRSYGDYAAQRRAAETPQPVKEERRAASNALTPEMEARYQQANGVNRAPNAYQTYMMQFANAQPQREETRSTDELRRYMIRQNRLAAGMDRMAADASQGIQERMYDQNYTDYLRNIGNARDQQVSRAAAATELYQTVSTQRREQEEREKYSALMSNPDFAAKSQGDPKIGNKVSATALSPAERLYQDIYNRDRRSGDAKNNDAARYTSDEEAGVFFYLWNTQGPKAATAYYQGFVENRAGQRRAEEAQAQAARYGAYDPVGASIASVGYNVMSGVGLVDMALQNLTRAVGITDRNKPLNYNSDLQLPGQVTDALRQGVADYLEELYPNAKIGNSVNVASFLYQTGMSMADSGVAVVLNMMGVPEPLTLAGMGAAAGTRAIREARERGASDGQALAFGISSAIMEALFEKVSLDSILKESNALNLRRSLKNVLKQGFTEGSEEVSTTLANTVADQIIMGDKSELFTMQRQLMEQGVSEDEALAAAFKKWGTGILGDAIGGFISGVGMGGPKEIYNAATNPLYGVNENTARMIDEIMEGRAPQQAAPPAATPPLPQQSAQGNAATPATPPLPQNAAQRPTEQGGLRLTPELSGGYNSLTQRQDVAWGENDTTWTEGNRPVKFTYAVVPLESLIVSNDKYGGVNKNYPAELQPRDRQRATSQGQVQGMANSLVPQKLAASATAQNGAPLIRGDGVVIGGNGRSAAISLAYEKGMAGAYESFIRENGSRYGVDTRNLPKNPVLVRVVNGDEDWRSLAQELNVSSTAAYSATETAQTDATKIGDVLGLLVPNDDGDINTAANQDFIQAFVNRVVPSNERGRMQTPAGLLSQDGLDRAINAIFAYAYGDTKLLTQFSEDLDPDMKNVINALAQSAPAVAALQSAIQEGSAYDIPARDTLLEALSIYRDARQEGKSVIEYLQQGDMLRQGNAEAAFIAGFIEQNKSSAKQLRFLFSALMQEVLDYGSPDQGSMFGGEDHDIQTALNGAVRRYGELSGKGLQAPGNEAAGRKQEAPDTGGDVQRAESLPADGGNRAGDEEDAGTGGAGLPGAVRGEVAPQEEDAPLSLPTEEAPSEAQEEERPLTLPQEESRQPHEKLADAVRAELEEGNTITGARLQELAQEAYGGTRGSGAYDIKTAYDAMELAVNQYLMDADFVKQGNGDAETAVRTEMALQQFMGLLPTETVRTEEQQQFQQFSTPPNIAYLAAWAANIDAKDTVLEPSAGIGGLALWPKAWGATVYGNELSPRRAEILRSLGLDEVFTENAEQINNVLPDRIKPTVVLMNPPFSSAAGRLNTNSTANAKRHIEQALDRLEDGGRLVAILGRGMANDSKTFAPWWNDLRKEYSIRANLSIDGENFKKYGTTFGVQMVVIDKTGPQTGETITGSYTDLTEIPSALEGIRNDRTQVERRPGNGGERGSGVHAGSGTGGNEPGRAAGSSERPGGNTPRNGGSGTSGSTGNGGRVQPDGAGSDGLQLGGDSERSGVGDKNDGNALRLSPESEPERNGGPGPEQPVRGLNQEASEAPTEPAAPKPKKTAASAQKAGNDDNVYAEYIPPKTKVKGAKKHPAKLVESAAMAAVDSPAASYTPKIPKELIASGALSDVQMTNIVYAGQAHSQMIPNQNKRKGYFIGDGTGVGKGRQLAGIILDNYMQGRKKALWISKGQNLYPDAQRDWKAMGMDPKEVYSTEKIKADSQIKADSGILFSTYDTLANSSKKGKSRIDQIVEWLGEDFDGVICFDEAHTMGNLLGKQSKRGNSKPAQRALAGAELQKRLPNARIVYASATMATDVSEMAFAERLGLWGPGTQFNDVRDFVNKISDGGMAAMELVARDMKALGVYQARSISYDGVEYETLQHDLSPMQKEIYDTMSRAWQVTLQNMNKALEMTGANLNGNAKSKAKSAYYGALQRFYNQILTSMAVPSVIQDMKKELAAGRSVVIQIVNTNEAETERQLAKAKETGADLEELDITPRENLIGFFRNSFPVQVYEEVEDENGNKHSVPVTDSQGNPVLDKKAVALRDRMIAEIESMSVPEGPLEMIYDAFGTENVAEVTGRKRRIVPGKDEYGNTVKVEEKRGSKSGEADATAFQEGKKRILIFSDAGGTGKSYHADRTAQNQQQRVHYLLQPGWSAPKAVQGFGRTHRSNEASAPIYKLVTTDVKGQKRFVSTIARRLDQLGALTKGQRQTGSGMFSARDNLESDLATDSLYNFYRALVGGQIEGLEAASVLDKLGLTDKFTDRETGQIKVPDGAGRDMSLFLNRILALEYDEQNLVFDAFSRIFDDAYETALANGTLDMGMETVRADKIDILDDMVVREDPNSSATTNYVQAKLSEKARIVRNVDELKALRGDFIGLYEKKNGDVVGVFRTKDKTEADGSVVKQYILQTPQERKLSRYVEKTLKSECKRIPEKQWKTAWAQEVAKTPEYIETVKHMLTGSLLPVWNRLPKSGNVRVQRLIADDGRQYLGRIIDPSQIDGVLKSLGVTQGRTKQTYTAEDVINRVFKGGDRASLEENRIKLTRRRVGNEWRIEITGDNLGYLARQVPAIIVENINYKYRYFVPNGDMQRSTLEAILRQNPVRDIEAVRGVTEDSRDAENFNGNTAPRHPENWKTERVGDKDKTPMSLTDIVNMIRHDFDIPVTTGNIRSRDARAQYRKQPQSVRSKIANSIPDIAHELGHHLDNIFGIRESLSAAAKAEVVDALPESFKAQYKDKSTWPGEGIAEFLRRYLQNSETAIMDYPVFSEEFFGRLDTKARATLDKLADEVNAYYALSEQTGNWPVHNREDKGRDYRSLGEKLQDMNTHFRTLFIDSMEPIKQFEKEAGGKAYLFATNAAYAGNRAYAAITGDLYDLRGNKLGVGLQKALEGIHLNNKKEYSDFGMYLICRHGPERLAEGMRVFSHDAWDNTAFMEQTVEELAEKYPNFEEAAERLEEYQHALIEAYGVASGLYSQETIDGWMERWEHYVPFLRWFGETEKRPKGQKQGFANQTRIHGKAIGSGLEIVNPVDNIMENTVRLITASIRNEVMQEITKAAANTEGAGRWLEQVPMPLARKTWDGKGLKSKTLDEFDEYFKAKGKDLGKNGLDLIQQILDNAIDDLLVQYGRGKAHGDIVTVMKNGSPEYWKINDPDLLRSVTNMGPTRAGELLNYYGRVTRFITGNITGMNIVWSVASNMPRDIGTMFTFSKTKNIVKLLAGIGDSYVNRIKGDEASDLYKEYMALGGNSTSAQTADKDMAKKARKALQKQKTDWLNPLEWVEFAGDMIESGPRYAYYKICRTQYGMTPEEAFYAAMEITVNFKKAGVLSREVNILVPFFNASIQGVDRAARWIAAEDLPADQRKAGRARRIGVYLGASLAIAALSMALNGRTKKKRDDLEKLSTYTKNNYFVVQMRNGKYLAIPKPRELAIPISLFERLMETYVADNPHAFDDFWEYVTDNTLPGVVSGIAQGDWNSAVGDLGLWGTIHYLTSNQDFLGRPIVSSALQDLEAKDQYDPTTSKLAKLIGEVFNVSPKQLDFLGNNLFGGFWQWQKALAPVSGKADLTLGVQSKWIKDPLFSTDITNRMYDERERLKKAHNSNPEDIDLAIKYRTVSDISSFYGRYYRLAKNEEETPQSRVVREAMLDAILGVEQNANTEPARKFLLDVVDREGSTEYMPTVMDVTVKSDDGTVYALTAEEYFLHQTRYEALYYNYIRQAVDNQPKMSDEEKTSTVEAAKKIAGIVARGETVEDHGGTYKAYTKVKDLLEDGVSEGNLINYLAAADNADTDGSGKVSNAELLGAVSGLRLSGEESASLIGYSNESLGLKLRSVSDFGVDSGEYGLVLEALGDNTLSQANVTAAVDEVYGPTTEANKEEKAALWQVMNKSWKASKNPYDPDVGEQVQDGLILSGD
jgi:hypothetical protein